MPENTTTEGPLPFPFATLAHLKERWPDMPAGTDATAEILLEDASQFILDIAPAAKDAHPNTRKRVVCAVVKRSMAVPAEYEGLSNVQMGAGPYQRSGTVANAHGDFYLTRLEKKALGVGKQRAGDLDLLAGSRRLHEEYDHDQG